MYSPPTGLALAVVGGLCIRSEVWRKDSDLGFEAESRDMAVSRNWGRAGGSVNGSFRVPLNGLGLT